MMSVPRCCPKPCLVLSLPPQHQASLLPQPLPPTLEVPAGAVGAELRPGRFAVAALRLEAFLLLQICESRHLRHSDGAKWGPRQLASCLVCQAQIAPLLPTRNGRLHVAVTCLSSFHSLSSNLAEAPPSLRREIRARILWREGVRVRGEQAQWGTKRPATRSRDPGPPTLGEPRPSASPSRTRTRPHAPRAPVYGQAGGNAVATCHLPPSPVLPTSLIAKDGGGAPAEPRRHENVPRPERHELTFPIAHLQQRG